MQTPRPLSLDLVFKALADETRRQLLQTLCGGSYSIRDLAAPFDISFPAVAKHIAVLERAGLITRKKRGREQICTLNPLTLREAHRWLGFYESFWSQQLDHLEDYLSLLQE
ncbi:helix-turn-helix transcriptional regulator [Endozoicomonas sp. SM1973]|uniref:Helix-turn-helix transcriptional regulator n=1 Tax=Spartinivicinus marinus TaxID=2994442 RepID=A0A853I337_9GAMM|nr:metalloregulator ArsR/SmtB family transcription factor [Spartinivicinus marinus]MCX4026780.1 metalloregulator ArsR/SmtB family transcription factor [Spartinivicinus marinus]NYZ64614.1 helix-turn-helix transcriptional regulator [Spartinivicinus marinus]